MKKEMKAVHLNQKPLQLIRAIIEMASNEGDVVWDPFAGLCTTALASYDLNRRCYCAEIRREIFNIGVDRFKDVIAQPKLL